MAGAWDVVHDGREEDLPMSTTEPPAAANDDDPEDDWDPVDDYVPAERMMDLFFGHRRWREHPRWRRLGFSESDTTGD